MSARQTYSLGKNWNVLDYDHPVGMFPSGQDVDRFLSLQSYVKLTTFPFLAEGCDVSCITKHWVLAFLVCLDGQSNRKNGLVLCAHSVPDCTLLLYSGPELFLEPALIARINALTCAVILAIGNCASNSSPALATGSFLATAFIGSGGGYADGGMRCHGVGRKSPNALQRCSKRCGIAAAGNIFKNHDYLEAKIE